MGDQIRAGASPDLIAHRLGSGRWTQLHRGVYGIVGSPPTWRRSLIAACLAGGPAAVASHHCAARLWELPGVVETPVPEITVPRARAPRRPGMISHETKRLHRADTAIVDGIPVTSAARTLIDCAAIWPPLVLEEALDEAIRRHLTSLSRLRWRLRALCGSGRSGSTSLRLLVEARAAREPTLGSVLERRVLRLFDRAKLPRPKCQYEIRERGRLLARVDFAYPDALLAIEADGYRYHSGRVHWQQDLTRRNALTARGWRVIHVTADDVAIRGDEICRAVSLALNHNDRL